MEKDVLLPLVLTPCLAGAQITNLQRPNVVFIYAMILVSVISVVMVQNDPHSNVDRAAAQGVRFTNAHSAAATSTFPLCYACRHIPGGKSRNRYCRWWPLLQSSVGRYTMPDMLTKRL